jgi:hypothetical protein
MQPAFRNRALVGALLSGTLAGACSPSSVGPSPFRTAAPAIAESVTASESRITAHADGLSPDGLAARGWDCRPSPLNPQIITCSAPNQVHPVSLPGPPPPVDRPETIRLLVFVNGAFTGTTLLIRSDLYNEQTCPSTGAPYRFIARIGYYECRHESQAD